MGRCKARPHPGQPIGNVQREREVPAPVRQGEQRDGHMPTALGLPERGKVVEPERNHQRHTAEHGPVAIKQLIAQLLVHCYQVVGVVEGREIHLEGTVPPHRRGAVTHCHPRRSSCPPSRYQEFLYSTHMPQLIAPPSPGRPSRSPVDELRTRIWYRAVQLQSGLASAYAVELELEPHNVKRSESGISRPRKWDAYANGTRVPSRMKGKVYAVDIAEQRFPGTARYFDNPMWDVLKGTKLPSRQIDLALAKIGGEVQAVLRTVLPSDADVEQRALYDPNWPHALSGIGTFDALVATILLIAKSEAIGSLHFRESAFTCYELLLPAVVVLPEVGNDAVKLLWAIDHTCKHWMFLTPQRRLDVVIYSRLLRSHLDKFEDAASALAAVPDFSE